MARSGQSIQADGPSGDLSQLKARPRELNWGIRNGQSVTASARVHCATSAIYTSFYLVVQKHVEKDFAN